MITIFIFILYYLVGAQRNEGRERRGGVDYFHAQSKPHVTSHVPVSVVFFPFGIRFKAFPTPSYTYHNLSTSSSSRILTASPTNPNDH